MEKLVLTGCIPQQITEKLELKQGFRGKQIFKWVSTGVTDFDSMTNLSLELREELKQKAVLRSSQIENVLNDPDGTIKVVVKLADGNNVETLYANAATVSIDGEPVKPGDVLELRCEITERRGPLGFGKGVAKVDGKVACQAEISFAIGDKPASEE